MEQFTGKQYIQIAIANHFGLDQELWEERIRFVEDNECILESLVEGAKEKYLYMKAIRAYRDGQQGLPTGYIMSLDATASGIQIMSVLSSCETTAKAVNVINEGTRKNVYADIVTEMNTVLVAHGENEFDFLSNIAGVKEAGMTVFYNSKAVPRKVFGDDSPQLDAFYTVLNSLLPGAMDVLTSIDSCIDKNSLESSWTLPDGHMAYVPVMTKESMQIKIEEFNNRSFTFLQDVNKADPFNVALVANIVHSIDGYIVREVTRRCSYKYRGEIESAYTEIAVELMRRGIKAKKATGTKRVISFAESIAVKTLRNCETEDLVTMRTQLRYALTHNPDSVIHVHDCFMSSPNNMQIVREVFTHVLAEINTSNILETILREVTQDEELEYTKMNTLKSSDILNSSYALS